MAMRPTDIQVILQISRDAERLQYLQQQYGRRQQEHLTAYMERQLEEKKKQASPVQNSGEAEIRAIHEDDSARRQNNREQKKRFGADQKIKKKLGESVDLFI